MWNDVLSNQDIDLIVSTNQKLKKHYRGTWSKDTVPNLSYKNNEWSIINLQNNDDGGGTHWVVFINQNDKLLFLDSYGVYPPEIIKAISRESDCDDIWYQYERLQSQNSQICGWYCLAFIEMIIDGIEFEKIGPTTLNDDIVREFMSRF